MRSNHSFQSYYIWLQEGIKKVLSENKATYPFTLVDYKYSKKESDLKLVVQVTGKNVYSLFSPQEIYSNRSFLSCFSPIEASRITELALLETAKSSFDCDTARSLKLSENIMNRDCRNELVFKDLTDQTEVVKSANYVMQNKNFRDKILPEDLFKVGYLCGISFISDVKNKIMKFRDKTCQK